MGVPQGRVLQSGQGTDRGTPLEVELVEEGCTYTDGSRIDGRAAAAPITGAEYLGLFATVMDTDMLGAAMGWEMGTVAATDSQAAIGSIPNLQWERPKGCIAGRVENEVSRRPGLL